MGQDENRMPSRDLVRAMLSEADAAEFRFEGAEDLLMEKLGSLSVITDGDDGVIAYEKDPYRIRILYVREEERGIGKGRALVQGVIKVASEAGASRVLTDALPSQKDFYVKEGFFFAGGNTYEYLLGRELLNKTVTVTVENPLGSWHPNIPDLAYPVNAGYTIYNGNVIDAYVISDEACDTFTGCVCAVLWRRSSDIFRVIVTRIGEAGQKKRIISLIGILEQSDDVYIEWAV